MHYVTFIIIKKKKILQLEVTLTVFKTSVHYPRPQGGRHDSHAHLKDEEVEAQRGNMTCGGTASTETLDFAFHNRLA